MIKIIGTKHTMSKDEIYKILEEEKPEVIVVELCANRYNTLVMPLLNSYIDEKPKENDSLLGKISNLIKRKSEEENIQYGGDMINSCLYAKEKDIPLVLGDLDVVKITELMSLIPKEEQEGFLREIQEFENKSIKEETKDINEMEVLKELKKRYPVAFEFLVNMRNLVLINNILKAEKKYPNKKIVCILGVGHVKTIEGALNE